MKISRTGTLLAILFAIITFRFLRRPSLKRYRNSQLSASSRPQPVTVRFLGVSTIVFDDGTTAIMTDGFLSRPPLRRLIFERLVPDLKRIRASLAKANVGSLAAVLVTHSHYDHALDSATVARATSAELIGSTSTANIARGEHFPEDRIRIVRSGEVITFGDFKVTVFQTPHSPKPRYPGTIHKTLRVPAKVSDYREGGNYSYLIEHPLHRFLVVPSANYVPRAFEDVEVHTVFLSIALLSKQSEKFVSEYWAETVLGTRAKLVVPIHWDDFSVPLCSPLKAMPRFADDIDKAMKVLTALAQRDGIAVELPTAFDPMRL